MDLFNLALNRLKLLSVLGFIEFVVAEVILDQIDKVDDAATSLLEDRRCLLGNQTRDDEVGALT